MRKRDGVFSASKNVEKSLSLFDIASRHLERGERSKAKSRDLSSTPQVVANAKGVEKISRLRFASLEMTGCG